MESARQEVAESRRVAARVAADQGVVGKMQRDIIRVFLFNFSNGWKYVYSRESETSNAGMFTSIQYKLIELKANLFKLN